MAKKRGNGEGSITKRKDGLWMASMTLSYDSQTGEVKRTYYYGKTRKEVQVKLNDALHNKRAGTFVEPNKVTFNEFLDYWLNEHKKPCLRSTTWDSYETMVRVHIKPSLGSIKLKDLRPDQLQRMYNEKLQSGRVDGKGGLSRRTVRYIHTVIHDALDQAVKNGLVARNVSEATSLPPENNKEIQPLNTKQVRSLLEKVREDRLYPVILLAVGTGLRRGELLGLRWQDIDFKKGTLHVRQSLVRIKNRDDGPNKTQLIFQEPKTQQSKRVLPIPLDILEELKSHKIKVNYEKLRSEDYNDHDLVFCLENGEPLEPRNLTRHFEKLIKQAGLPRIRFHDIRHYVEC